MQRALFRTPTLPTVYEQLRIQWVRDKLLRIFFSLITNFMIKGLSIDFYVNINTKTSNISTSVRSFVSGMVYWVIIVLYFKLVLTNKHTFTYIISLENFLKCEPEFVCYRQSWLVYELPNAWENTYLITWYTSVFIFLLNVILIFIRQFKKKIWLL